MYYIIGNKQTAVVGFATSKNNLNVKGLLTFFLVFKRAKKV